MSIWQRTKAVASELLLHSNWYWWINKQGARQRAGWLYLAKLLLLYYLLSLLLSCLPMKRHILYCILLRIAYIYTYGHISVFKRDRNMCGRRSLVSQCWIFLLPNLMYGVNRKLKLIILLIYLVINSQLERFCSARPKNSISLRTRTSYKFRHFIDPVART